MALSKIKKDSITDDAIDASKVADTAVSGQTELSETAANNDVFLIFDTTAGTLKKIQRTNVIIQAPTLTSISPTTVQTGDGTGNHTFTITGTKFDGTATATFINSSGAAVAFDSVTRNSTTQITAVIAKSSLPDSGEPYDIKVTNGNNLTVTLENQVNVNAQPVFTTSAGSLGTFSEQTAVNVTVNATDPESAGNVTFELQSGTLPPGLSLTNEGTEGGTARISGTLSTDRSSSTTSNFVLRAVDAASNTSSRAFSITEVPSGRQSFLSSGTFSVPTGITTVDVLVVAGGGQGARAHGSTGVGGGGAGGLIFRPGFPVTPGGTVSVTVGCGADGGAGTGSGTTQGSKGQNSVFGTLTAIGGGAGSVGQCQPNPSDQDGGSGGGGGYGRGGGSAQQPTQPGDSGAYGFGSAGGSSAQTGSGEGGSGGGGAGAVGAQAGATGPSTSAGNGGAGKQYTIADGTTAVYYAGGGGGSGGGPSGPNGTGGQGGGTDGTISTGSSDAGNNKGGGSGGTRGDQVAGAGGKGIVVVSF